MVSIYSWKYSKTYILKQFLKNPFNLIVEGGWGSSKAEKYKERAF